VERVVSVHSLWSIPQFRAVVKFIIVIYKYAGLDASKAYNEIHASSLIAETLGTSKRIGKLDPTSVDKEWQIQYSTPTSTKSSPKSSSSSSGTPPPLQTIINSFDFEEVGKRFLKPKTWAFYSSAATDLITMRANRSFLDSIWFRPRGLVNVKNINTRSKILGIDVDLPIFVAPAALAKLAHPEGEKALARACGRTGIPQCVSIACKSP
jgi:L-lactate dehydrogenase (cytochrome)